MCPARDRPGRLRGIDRQSHAGPDDRLAADSLPGANGRCDGDALPCWDIGAYRDADSGTHAHGEAYRRALILPAHVSADGRAT